MLRKTLKGVLLAGVTSMTLWYASGSASAESLRVAPQQTPNQVLAGDTNPVAAIPANHRRGWGGRGYYGRGWGGGYHRGGWGRGYGYYGGYYPRHYGYGYGYPNYGYSYYTPYYGYSSPAYGGYYYY